MGHRASFPLPANVEVDEGEDGCPNPWAVKEGLHGQIMGFQTTNNHSGFMEGKGAVASPAQVESALWNLTLNSNGVFIELYEERLWEIFKSLGSGESAPPLSPNLRIDKPTAPYSRNLHEWMKELHDRRRTLANNSNEPNLADPFPKVWEHTFSKQLNRSKTYYYINPAKCSSINGPRRVATVTVNP